MALQICIYSCKIKKVGTWEEKNIGDFCLSSAAATHRENYFQFVPRLILLLSLVISFFLTSKIYSVSPVGCWFWFGLWVAYWLLQSLFSSDSLPVSHVHALISLANSALDVAHCCEQNCDHLVVIIFPLHMFLCTGCWFHPAFSTSFFFLLLNSYMLSFSSVFPVALLF